MSAKPSYLEVSTSVSSQNTLYFNSPRDLTIPQRRFGMDANGLPNKVAAGGIASGYLYPIFAAPTSPNYLAIDDVSATSLEGTDVILTDVISFSVLPISIVNGTPRPRPTSLRRIISSLLGSVSSIRGPATPTTNTITRLGIMIQQVNPYRPFRRS